MGWAVANYDYAANQPNQLSLERGDRVAIINKAGESRGWWKGQIHGRVGVTWLVEGTDTRAGRCPSVCASVSMQAG